MDEVFEAKTNGSEFAHEPEVPIPEPVEKLPKFYDATGHTLKRPTMAPKVQSWFQQHVVTIALVLLTGIITFTYQQFQVSALTKDNERLERMIKENQAKSEKDIADAQAYGVSALSQARFMQGLLIGKGIANPQDFQSQK